MKMGEPYVSGIADVAVDVPEPMRVVMADNSRELDAHLNRPALQRQIDDLERKVELLREAIFSLVSAHLPAMQAIDHLAEAAAKLNAVDSDG